MQYDAFREGCAAYRPLALWSLNHALEEDELRRQVAAMDEQRLAGFILHPRSGLLTPCMSEDWLRCIEAAVDEADRRGLQAWLYDEDPYPSGVAGGRVTAERPDFRAQSLECHMQAVRGPARVILDLPLERVHMALAVRLEGGKIAERRDLRPYIGTLRRRWHAERKYHAYYPTTFSKPIPQYRSDASGPQLRLEWDAPEGEWQVLAYVRRYCGPYFLFDSYTDTLKPEAVRYFLDLAYEPYKARLGRYFGGTIPGVFMDEPKYYAFPFPWTEEFAERFRARNGYPVEDALLAMKLPLEGAAAMRRDYWETVEESFHRAFVSQVGGWCRDNGLGLIGHASPEEEPADQVLLTGSIHRLMQGLDMPGCDLITYMIGDREHPILNLGPKMAASAARLRREGRALCECFGVTEWNLKLRDMAFIADWLYVLGVNCLACHTFVYSIDGYRKKDAGPSEFYQMPHFAYFGTFSDQLARLGYLLGEADPVAPTALLYPFDSWMALQPVDEPGAKLYRDAYTALFDRLLRDHLPFEVADIRDIREAAVEDGCLRVGKRLYRQVVVPPLAFLAQKTLDALRRLREGGVALICGRPDAPVPMETEGNIREAYDRLLEAPGVETFMLRGSAEEGFTLEGFEAAARRCADELQLFDLPDSPGCADLLVSHSRRDGRDVFFLCNTLREPVRCEAALTGRLAGRYAEEYPLEGREPEPLPYAGGRYTLQVPAMSGLLLVVDPERPARERREPRCEIVRELKGRWRFEPQSRNALLLDKWAWTDQPGREPDDIRLTELPRVTAPMTAGELGVTRYPADLTFKTVATVRGRPGRMALVRDLSAIAGAWEIRVNGRLCDEWTRVREYDCNNWECRLEPPEADPRFYRAGEWVIEVRVRVEEESQGLLEPLRLFGDFTVQLNQGESLGAVLTAAEAPELTTGSWTYQGYPHYGGLARYVQTVELPPPEEGARYFLEWDSGGDAAEAEVNGRTVGRAIRAPFRVEVTDAIREGENRVAMTVANTLENLLYGTQNPSGLTGPVVLWKQMEEGA